MKDVWGVGSAAATLSFPALVNMEVLAFESCFISSAKGRATQLHLSQRNAVSECGVRARGQVGW